MIERFRPVMELVGVTAIVISLLFVGYEIRETRNMNLAQLHFNRMAMVHSRITASMESETALGAWAKMDTVDWSSGLFTPTERAYLTISAHGQIAEWEADFRYIELGFSTRTLEDLQLEILFTANQSPQIELAWADWNMPGLDEYAFVAMMNETLSRSEP